MPCEDYPCCGHDEIANLRLEPGDCPDSSGRMKCVECGKRLPRTASSSICSRCLRSMNRRDEGDLDHDYGMNY